MARPLVVLFVLTALTLVVFALWPGIDLAVSHYFYDGGGFIGHSETERVAREFLADAPFFVLAAFAIPYLLRRFGRAVPWAPERPLDRLPCRDAGARARADRQRRLQGPLAPAAPLTHGGLPRRG